MLPALTQLPAWGRGSSRQWVGRCAAGQGHLGGAGGRRAGPGPCQEVLIPGTRHCAGAQPRDEVMKDRAGALGLVSSPMTSSPDVRNLSAWKTWALTRLLLDNPLPPASGAGEGETLGPALQLCCVTLDRSPPSLGFLLGPHGSESPSSGHSDQFPLKVLCLWRVGQGD